MLSAYTLCYGHWTVIPHQLEESFKDLADTGFDAVCLSFSESEMRYSRRAFELQVDLAHKAGLKVFVVPSRLGGRFAGAPLMPSFWLAMHPDEAVPNNSGWPVACLESGEFVEWILEFMTTLLSDYELDGIIWDEPKAVELVSHHPATLAKYGQDPTEKQMIEAFVEFMRNLTDHCESVRPGVSQTLFCQKFNPESFTMEAAKCPNLEYHGYDGNLARQSFFHEEPEWHKYRVESVWDRTVEECKSAGKKTFALVENMLMPKAAIAEFEENFREYMKNYRPDHLSIYYYAHNNEDPEAVQELVRRSVKEYLG